MHLAPYAPTLEILHFVYEDEILHYTISWLPTYVYYLYLSLSPRPHFTEIGYYASVSIAYLYMCTNPFVYATKFDPVKEVILRLIRCKKISE